MMMKKSVLDKMRDMMESARHFAFEAHRKKDFFGEDKKIYCALKAGLDALADAYGLDKDKIEWYLLSEKVFVIDFMPVDEFVAIFKKNKKEAA